MFDFSFLIVIGVIIFLIIAIIVAEPIRRLLNKIREFFHIKF